MDNIFEINNLLCSYNSEKIILKVDRLRLPAGKLITILGESGSGKSTFLESLGLMNNTLVSGSLIKFNPDNNINPYLYENIWNGDNRKVSEIRRKHFSFIFQDTNLMNNFSVYENICITQMLQGKSMDESIEYAKQFMNNIGLGELNEDKIVCELAGGEKQRVAFVRAITPEFSVIFGDEPTGNLDEKNSSDLMELLKKNVIGTKRIAVIVTHNIGLALKYSDMIVLINKINGVGEIHEDNTFNRVIRNDHVHWIDNSSEVIHDIEMTIREILKI